MASLWEASRESSCRDRHWAVHLDRLHRTAHPGRSRSLGRIRWRLRQRPGRDHIGQVEAATLEWVHWYNTERTHQAMDDLAPAAAEQLHHVSGHPRPSRATWPNWVSSCTWAPSSPIWTWAACRSRTTTATPPGTRWAPSCGLRASRRRRSPRRWQRPPAPSRTGRADCCAARTCPCRAIPEILVTGDLMCLDKLPGVAEVAMQTGL
jgi:hypothetical protein